MKTITKISVAAIAFVAFAGKAGAVTCTTDTPIDGVVVSDATTVIGGGGTYHAVGSADCPSDPAKADVSYVDSQNSAQDGVIAGKANIGDSYTKSEQDATDGAQDTVIATKASTSYVDSQNAAQNAVIDTKVNNTRLDSFVPSAVAPIGSLERWAGDVDGTLSSHDALLSQHSAALSSINGKLDDQAKGLAIAMSMPSTWLSDKKSFGIFGSVGGFDNETAVGFAAIGRLDETWSVNAKLGADTEFEQFGWQVGFGAQW